MTHFDGEDDAQETNPVIDSKNIGEDGIRIGEGTDAIQDEVL